MRKKEILTTHDDDRELFEAVERERELVKRLDPVMDGLMDIRDIILDCKSIKMDAPYMLVAAVPEVKSRKDQKMISDAFLKHWDVIRNELKSRFATTTCLTLTNINLMLRDYLLKIAKNDTSLSKEERKTAEILADDYHFSEILLQVLSYFQNIGYRNEFVALGRDILDIFTFDDGNADSKDVEKRMRSLELHKRGIALKRDIAYHLHLNGDEDECDSCLIAMYENEDAYNDEVLEGVSMQLLIYIERSEKDSHEDWLARARDLLERFVDKDTEANPENVIIFFRAKEIYEKLGETELSEYYDRKSKGFIEESNQKSRRLERGQSKKIYPNDPCPCGSGKKYKKCHGKR